MSLTFTSEPTSGAIRVGFLRLPEETRSLYADGAHHLYVIYFSPLAQYELSAYLPDGEEGYCAIQTHWTTHETLETAKAVAEAYEHTPGTGKQRSLQAVATAWKGVAR